MTKADSLKERLAKHEGYECPYDLLAEALARIEALEKENWQHQTSLIARDNLHEGACLRIATLEAENKRLRELISVALDYDPQGQVLGEEWNRAALKEIME